jgi:hypothetical protein
MATKYIKWPQSISNGHKVYQMATKYIKWPQSISNGHKVYQMAVKYINWSYNIPPSPISRPYKIYPNWNFWFENILSGNPGLGHTSGPIGVTCNTGISVLWTVDTMESNDK